MIAALALLTTNRSTRGETPAPAAPATQAPGNSIAVPPISTPPGSKADVVSVGPQIGAQSLIKLHAKFVEIDEPAWETICAENPGFQQIAAKAGFPETGQEQKSYAAIEAEFK